MKIALDTNILIAAHLPAHQDHAAARQKIEAHLAGEANQIVLTPAILHEFLHVITDSRRFENPPTMTEAIALSRNYLGKTNVLILASDALDMEETCSLLLQHQLGRDRVADTLFAATLKRHSVRQLWTKNIADFKLFDFLEATDPTA